MRRHVPLALAARLLAVPLLAGLLVAVGAGIGGAQGRPADSARLVIATGAPSGLYYPVGGAICRLMNRRAGRTGPLCDVDVTSGSQANLMLLLEGFYDFAIVQSDVLADAVAATGVLPGNVEPGSLRAVMRLHPEVVTVVVRTDSPIRSFADLSGRRVSAGEAGSGHAATFALLRDVASWPPATATNILSLPTSEQADRLCEGAIDAFVNVIGHPNIAIAETARRCSIRMVPLDEALIARTVERTRTGLLPIAMPQAVYDDVAVAPGNSLATHAVLVTRDDVAADTVSTMVRAVLDDMDTWRAMNIVMARIGADALRLSDLPVPAHAGAQRAFGRPAP